MRTSQTGLDRLCLLMKRHKFTTEILYDGSTWTFTGISVNTDIAHWSSLMYAYELSDQDIYIYIYGPFSVKKPGLMTLRNYNVMSAWKPPKLMIFRTPLYFHENTFVVLIYQNTFEFRQNSVIIMTYVAMTTHIPWLPHNHGNINYTIPKAYNLYKNVESCKL